MHAWELKALREATLNQAVTSIESNHVRRLLKEYDRAVNALTHIITIIETDGSDGFPLWENRSEENRHGLLLFNLKLGLRE